MATNAIHPKMASFGFAAAQAPIRPARLLSFILLPRLPSLESRTDGCSEGTAFRGVLGEAASLVWGCRPGNRRWRSHRMDTRELGRTGVKVSPLCLGAMMFGAWGNPDHDESVRDHPPRARRRASTSSTPPTSTRAASPRRSSARRCKGRRDEVVLATKVHGDDGRRPEPARQLAPLDRARGRGQPAPAADRLDRPLPGPPPRPVDRHRRDARRADRPRARGQGALHRLARRSRRRRSSRRSGSPSGAGRERFVCEQPPYSILVRGDRGRGAAGRASSTAWA